MRDYAIHPEVRAALMVTVDAAGFRVFDPWDTHWDDPLLTVGVNELGERLDELRAEEITRIAAEVNDRPRKTLGWQRPADLFDSARAAA